MLSSGANVIIWSKCYHLEQMLSFGANAIIWSKCSHVGRNIIIWDEMLLYGMKAFRLKLMPLSRGDVFLWS